MPHHTGGGREVERDTHDKVGEVRGGGEETAVHESTEGVKGGGGRVEWVGEGTAPIIKVVLLALILPQVAHERRVAASPALCQSREMER